MNSATVEESAVIDCFLVMVRIEPEVRPMCRVHADWDLLSVWQLYEASVVQYRTIPSVLCSVRPR